MTPRKPKLALDRMTDALEAEILAASEAEVRDLTSEADVQARLDSLRLCVERAVAEAEGRGGPPPQARFDRAWRRP